MIPAFFLPGCHIDRVMRGPDWLVIHARSRRDYGRCPSCGTLSSAVHNLPGGPNEVVSAAQIIGGLGQLVARAQLAGLKAPIDTMTPFEGTRLIGAPKA